MSTIEELEKRIAYLEDIEAIKQLKYKYARACDEHNAQLWREVFTEDAIWDGGEKYGGIHKIGDLIKRVESGRGPYAPVLHYFTNPVITIEGNKGYGRFLMWRASTTISATLGATSAASDRAVWVVGYEDDEYVKIDGRWRQSKLKLELIFQIQTPYEENTDYF